MEPTPEQLRALARQVAGTSVDEIDCDVSLNRVAAFFEAIQSNIPLSSELRAVAQHLQVCPACLEEYQSLCRAMGNQ